MPASFSSFNRRSRRSPAIPTPAPRSASRGIGDQLGRASLRAFGAIVLLVALLGAPSLCAAAHDRTIVSLDGPWQFQRDGAKLDAWRTVAVPSSFESHEGSAFDGVGWYRRTIKVPEVPAGSRLLISFEAAATEAEVWWDDHKLGSHLGGWTPFRFDVTEHATRPGRARTAEIKIRLDEKVGHNTQGFLPIVAPHFGGLWQGIQLMVVPSTWIDDLHLLAAGDPRSGELTLEVPLLGATPDPEVRPAIRYRVRGTRSWSQASPRSSTYFPAVNGSPARWLVIIPIRDAGPWSPESPALYEVEISLPGIGGDVVRTRTGFRHVEARGTGFFLNGRPLSVRGILNWGYSPPRLDPNPGEAVWRREIALARDQGFNLMKFCLWIPPQRYLELADELGMLAWMEYPTWHPTMTRKFLEPLRREFAEFHAFDRNHPSILFRSLTCETGSGAELEVIKTLYDQAHAMIPGALVEDDSSWIQWNRVSDFYDDHPYGNNHTWVETLSSLKDYIKGREPKPLLLGEAIAADTWTSREAIVKRVGRDRPFWVPPQIDDQPRWLEESRTAGGDVDPARLTADSLRYGLLMRKYQIEAFRREVPEGGYVSSVIRDIPTAAMGFIDFLGKPKWPAADWSWHGDTMLLLKTDQDHRGFAAGSTMAGDLLLSHFGPKPFKSARLTVVLEDPRAPGVVLGLKFRPTLAQPSGSVEQVLSFAFDLPQVTSPEPRVLRAVLQDGPARWENRWPIWILPSPPAFDASTVHVHKSLAPEAAAELFPGAVAWNGSRVTAGVIVASRFDTNLAASLENGARVLLLPDGEKGSLPLSAHWFLRGAPWMAADSKRSIAPHDLLLELQHFDLASSVVPGLHYVDSIDPILMLWDTHDLKAVKSHGLIFETRVGQGRLLVSAVRHRGQGNAAGRWLLGVLANHVAQGPLPRHTFRDEYWQQVKDKLREDKIDLTERPWRFRPDPEIVGVTQGWQKPSVPTDDGWRDIRVGAHWEGQGYPNLDRWAWYRIQVRVPEHWLGSDIYLSFEGVDDCYELFLNGELAGKGGDPEKKIDTFSERRSWKITSWAKPGQDLVIAVRVYDWYGAGGVFRPVTLGTRPFSSTPDILK